MRLIIFLLLLLFFINIFFKCGSSEHFESLQTSSENNVNMTIPKIIIQTWKSNEIPEKYNADIESVKKMNPDYKYIFFTDDDIENFLKTNYPDWYTIYQKLPIKIQKIDFFRYVAVYHYGGFYLDLDMTGLKSLDPLLNMGCVFPIDQYIGNCDDFRFTDFCNRGQNFLLGQYAFGASQFNPFVKELVENIASNIDKYIQDEKTIYEGHIGYNLYVYKSTGPDFVTEIYVKSPYKNDIKILHYPEHQYFGEYAKHNFYGTWK